MKKLIFRLCYKEGTKIASLINEINKISCRIYFDIENGLITVENIDDGMISNVIELVDMYYNIESVEIDNTYENPKAQKEIVTETIQEPIKEEKQETVIEDKRKVLEEQFEKDLKIKKIEFQNKHVEEILNKFMKTASWAMFKMNATEKEIGYFIYTAIDEINMKYNKKDCIDFNIGDIVDCRYGYHLPGEINGTYVHGIVCDISKEGMVYIVPITKAKEEDLVSSSYLEFRAPKDAVYKTEIYNGGIALLDKGKYIHPARLNCVIGNTSPEFFNKLLKKLASTFDFTNDSEYSDEDLFSDIEIPNMDLDELDEHSDREAKESIKNIGNEESALYEVVGTVLDKLDKTKPISEQVEFFIKEIGMQTSSDFLILAFLTACNIEKINYENILSKLHELKPDNNSNKIKEALKQDFKNWLKQYPKLSEKCPKISIISLLKVFVKRISRD